MTSPRQMTKRKEASTSNPCPVCDGTHGCSTGEDGLIFCRRRQGSVQGFVYLGQAKGDPQWGMYRHEGDPTRSNGQEERFQRQSSANGRNPRRRINWVALLQEQRLALTPERRDELALSLELPPASLTSLAIGYCVTGPHADHGPCWTFPETDATGKVIGIMCRYVDGKKMCWPGSTRGLTIPIDWQKRPGPILCPEGASDTLALTALGLPAIGRPSNTGGVVLLATLFSSLPSDRQIIILGEYDPKDDGKWPGRDGAVKTAIELGKRLNRPVQWALPP
jgi:hypothetical protein